MCISRQPVIQGTQGPDRLQGERAGCSTRLSDVVITDPSQSPGAGRANGERRRTSGLSPSTRTLDVGFTGAQAVPSSASPLDPLSRKPHPRPQGFRRGLYAGVWFQSPDSQQVGIGQARFYPSRVAHTWRVQAGLFAHSSLSSSSN